MTTSYRISAATGIHIGDREYQQDQVTVLRHPRSPFCALAVLADGMGGRSGGRKAADQVLMTARQLFERYTPSQPMASRLLAQIAYESHTVIRLNAISSEQEPHSTIAAVLVNPQGDCHWVHVGDSRIYHFRNGRLIYRTKDHSYVQALVDNGQITPQDALTHPQSNILIGCLGASEDPPVVTHCLSQLQQGDSILLCSDGLWHYLSPEEMATTIQTMSGREAVESMIVQARERATGRGDNISLVILKVLPSAKKSKGPKEARSSRLPSDIRPGEESGVLSGSFLSSPD